MSNFEKATRQKIRFASPRGLLSVEDLWDLPLQSAKGASLDGIAIELNRALKDSSVVSFVTETTSANEALQLRFDVVKHVIDVRKAEAAEAKVKSDRAAQRARILELIAKKQDQALEGKSLDELTAMVSGLS